MIETLVTYVSAQTSENVLRIAAIATTRGIAIAGRVPKTKNRMISAPIRPLTGAELLEHPLICLVRGVAGDRERLEPALRDLAGGVSAEDGEDEPRADHVPAAAGDDVGEAREHLSPFRGGCSCCG